MSIKDQLLLQEEYDLNAEEVFFIQLLFLAQSDEDKDEFINKYFSLNRRGDARKMLEKFKDVGVIKKSYKIPNYGDDFVPSSIEFNAHFFKKYLAYSGDLGYELWAKYPDLLFIKNKSFTAKNISKKFNSMEEFFFAYGKAIKFNPKTHAEVMELLEFAIDNNLINSGICDYVISRLWLTHKKLKEEGFEGGSLDINEWI